MKELISLHSAAGQLLTLLYEQEQLMNSPLIDEELRDQYQEKIKQLENAYTFMLYRIIAKIEVL